MQQACVDPSKVDFELAVTDYSPFRDCCLGNWSSCSRSICFFSSRVQLFRQSFDSFLGFFDDIGHYSLNAGIGIHHPFCISLNQHRQVQACNDSELAVWIFTHDTASLVEWRATPKVSQDQHFIVRIKRSHSVIELCIEIIWSFVGHESYNLYFFLLTENHRT